MPTEQGRVENKDQPDVDPALTDCQDYGTAENNLRQRAAHATSGRNNVKLEEGNYFRVRFCGTGRRAEIEKQNSERRNSMGKGLEGGNLQALPGHRW